MVMVGGDVDDVINACDVLAESETVAANNSTDCRVVNLIYKLSIPSPIIFSNRMHIPLIGHITTSSINTAFCQRGYPFFECVLA